MKLETGRLLLRDWEQRDIPNLIEGINDLSVSQWLAFVPHPYTEKDARNWIDFCAGLSKQEVPNQYEFAIELKSDDRVIGGVSLIRIN